MRIYVASSWRNKYQPDVVGFLRGLGHEVYDFRHPPHGRGGFAWSEIDANWITWTAEQWREALKHPLAVEGFKADQDGMEWAHACVLVLPSGRSAHLEAGWFTGKSRPCWVFAPEPVEPDLMVGLCQGIAVNLCELAGLVGYPEKSKSLAEVPARRAL